MKMGEVKRHKSVRGTERERTKGGQYTDRNLCNYEASSLNVHASIQHARNYTADE